MVFDVARDVPCKTITSFQLGQFIACVYNIYVSRIHVFIVHVYGFVNFVQFNVFSRISDVVLHVVCYSWLLPNTNVMSFCECTRISTQEFCVCARVLFKPATLTQASRKLARERSVQDVIVRRLSVICHAICCNVFLLSNKCGLIAALGWLCQ